MRIAVIGSGVAGLVAAHYLAKSHDVSLFESDGRLGGHAHTHRVELPDASVDVDSGFLVYNDRTYPVFQSLLAELGIATHPSDMSFGVVDEQSGLEWRGTSFNTVFAQRRNLVAAGFLKMLRDIGRFHRIAHNVLEDAPDVNVSLEDVLGQHRWSKGFREWYLVPLGASIWSADPSNFTKIPAMTVLRFFERHGLLDVGQHPNWRTVSGGSANYVEAIARPLRNERRVRLNEPVESLVRKEDGVWLTSANSAEMFDQVVIAAHSDQALRLLPDADRTELEVLSAIRYQPNRATLHTDASLMPKAKRAWASWNFHRLENAPSGAALTYHLNQLQGLSTTTPIFVTLNRDDAIDPSHVISNMDYAHPIFDAVALRAQARRNEVQGRRRTWFCGAYWGYGFHEDGARSAIDVCRALGVTS